MKEKIKIGIKLTDAERHKRFVETAHAIKASENAKDFDVAFKAIALIKKKRG